MGSILMDQLSGKYGGPHKSKQSPGSLSVTCWNNNSYAPNTRNGPRLYPPYYNRAIWTTLPSLNHLLSSPV